MLQLQNNKLTITAGDITKVLEENISKSISKEQQEAIQTLQEHLAKVQTESVEILERIITAKDKAIDDIKKTGDDQIQTIKKIASTTKGDLSIGKIFHFINIIIITSSSIVFIIRSRKISTCTTTTMYI